MIHPSAHPAPAFVNTGAQLDRTPKLLNPILNTTSGIYINDRTVTATNPNGIGTVFFRINGGSDQTGNSETLFVTSLIEFQIRENGFLPSDWVGVYVQIKCAVGNPIPPAGTYDDRFPINVKFNGLNPGATTYYTTDGSAPNTGSALYDGVLGIDLSVDTTLRWFSEKAGTINSNFGNAIYDFEMVLDPDVTAYLAETGQGGDPVLLAGLNNLVLELKSENIWDKIKALYVFYGENELENKLNVKNPADTDAAFRLSFVNPWTFSKNGATPDTSSYANTFLNPQIIYESSSGAGVLAAFNSRTPDNLRAPIGSGASAPNRTLYIRRGTISGVNRIVANNVTTEINMIQDQVNAAYAQINDDGTHFISSFAGVVSGVNTPQSPWTPGNVFIGAANINGSPTAFFRDEIRGAAITDKLTTSEALTLCLLIDDFNALVRS